MRRWRYVTPGDFGNHGEPVIVEMSEAEIIATYYPYWQEQMRRVGKESQISEQECINDWVVVHWAEEVPESCS